MFARLRRLDSNQLHDRRQHQRPLRWRDAPAWRGFSGFCFSSAAMWYLAKRRQHPRMQEAQGRERTRSGSARALEGYT